MNMKKIFFLICLIAVLKNIFAQQKYTIEGVVKHAYSPSYIDEFTSSNKTDDFYFTISNEGILIKKSFKDENFKEAVYDIYNIPKFSYNFILSNTDKYILFESNKTRIYRHSYRATYFIYDSEKRKLSELINKPVQSIMFSPNDIYVSYVYDNNLFIKEISSEIETQITFDGKENKIKNGIPDWVYEEEFGFSRAYEWSPNSEFIGFIKFDESNVKEYNLQVYAGDKPRYEEYALYPGLYTYKYPKAGEKNSIVSVYLYSLKDKKIKKIILDTNDNDFYIPRIKWDEKNNLYIFKVNRLQNKCEVYFYNPYTNTLKIIYTEKNSRYIGDEFYDNFFVYSDYFIFLSEKDGWRHIYLYRQDENTLIQLTKGNFDVTKIYGINSDKKFVFFQAAKNKPYNKEIYKVNIENQKLTKLSSNDDGTNEATFSKKFNYFVNEFSNINTPPIFTLHNSDGKLIRVLENNDDYKNEMNKYPKIQKSFDKFKTSQNIELYGLWKLPADFDTNKKYPVIVMQYSGPNSQSVENKWEVGWEEYLAQEGFLIFIVDTRGTGCRGEEFRKCTYMNLGKYETIDLIETAKYLQTKKFIDSTKIGIWGWSYGGFMVLNAMTKGNGIYKVGISVAPVTSWRFYDNIYTERYNGLPKDNPNGYDENSPLYYTDKFKGELLLVFGTADDNVHPQNSYEFIEKMVQSKKQFQMFSYTNRNHGIYGGNTRYHLYEMKTNFFKEKLKSR